MKPKNNILPFILIAVIFTDYIPGSIQQKVETIKIMKDVIELLE